MAKTAFARLLARTSPSSLSPTPRGGSIHGTQTAYCFRKFHALISDLVQGAWVRYVRQQNLTLIGETADLHEFLFGSERNSMAMVRRYYSIFSGAGASTAIAAS